MNVIETEDTLEGLLSTKVVVRADVEIFGGIEVVGILNRRKSARFGYEVSGPNYEAIFWPHDVHRIDDGIITLRGKNGD